MNICLYDIYVIYHITIMLHKYYDFDERDEQLLVDNEDYFMDDNMIKKKLMYLCMIDFIIFFGYIAIIQFYN
jgi:hypothetical protein